MNIYISLLIGTIRNALRARQGFCQNSGLGGKLVSM